MQNVRSSLKIFGRMAMKIIKLRWTRWYIVVILAYGGGSDTGRRWFQGQLWPHSKLQSSLLSSRNIIGRPPYQNKNNIQIKEWAQSPSRSQKGMANVNYNKIVLRANVWLPWVHRGLRYHMLQVAALRFIHLTLKEIYSKIFLILDLIN